MKQSQRPIALKGNPAAFVAALCLLGVVTQGAIAQVLAPSIVPAADGTGTIATPQGNQIDLSGGRTSGDGANLFHSFQQFGLSQNQIANFLSNPGIRNIFGRVVGGDASIINGLIQVTGGNANLYLMNPAGIVFGANASLNVPASFMATTANGIRFGGNWLNAIGSNDYATLLGNPTGFAFTMPQPGAIVNAGNLAVGTGQALTLLGGTVVTTGSLTAPGGQITVAAVPGSSLVRLSQPGSLLSFEIQPVTTTTSVPMTWTLPILSLPQLLTGGTLGSATGLTVKGNGQVELTNSGVPIPAEAGSAIASGTLNTSGQTGGTIQVLGDRVGVLSATMNATGTNNGGTVLIGGDYQGKGTLPNADRTYVSADSTITADSLLRGNGGKVIVWADESTGFYGTITARGGTQTGNGGFVEVSGKQTLMFDGNVNVGANNGNLGTLILDPTNITISNAATTPGVNPANVLVNDFSGTAITINAGTLGSQTGNIVLQAANDITISQGVSLSFAAGAGSITFTADADKNGSGIFQMDTTQTITVGSRGLAISGAAITLGNVNARGGAGAGGAVTLAATRDISVGSIATTADTGGGSNLNPSGSVKIVSDQGAIDVRGSITAGSNQGNTGSITLNAKGNITTAEIENQPTTPAGKAGDITLISTDGSITTNRFGINPISGNPQSGILSGSAGSSSGKIRLEASGDIITGTISSGAATTGGKIELVSRNGNIDTTAGNITSVRFDGGTTAVAGNVSFTANGSIQTGNILSNGDSAGGTIALMSANGNISIAGNINSGSAGSGGNISLTSNNGSIDTSQGKLQSTGSQGNSGSVSLTAKETIVTSTIETLNSGTNGGNAGDINLTSAAGGITTNGILDAGSSSGNGGGITLNAQNGITTSADVIAYALSSGNAGNLSLNSETGTIVANGRLFANSNNGQGGAINLSGQGIQLGANLFLGSSAGQGGGALTIATPGTVTLPTNISANGADIVAATQLTTLAGLATGSTIDTGGGNLSFSFASDITIDASISLLTNGGDITLRSPGNLTVAGVLNSSSTNGAGGKITLTSDRGTVTSADLTSSGTTRGGDITITAQTQITTGRLNSSASVGDGGNVTLDPTGDVQVSSINAQGGTNGSGGDVLITTGRFFRATDTFNGVDSISAIGGTGGGDIIIRHGGGGLTTPFIVGDGTINGTAGAIATLNNVISPTRSFPGIYWQFGSSGNIGIITSEPRPPENTKLAPLKEDQESSDASLLVYGLEELFTRQYEEYWQIPAICKIKTLDEIQATLRNIEAQTGVKPAAIYAFFQPATVQDQVIGASAPAQNDCGGQRKPLYKPTIGADDPLGLMLVTGNGKPIVRWVDQARRQAVEQAIAQFQQAMRPRNRDSKSYLPLAQQFHQWLIDRLDADLKQQGIQNLVFILDAPLRTLPLAALHDGKAFLVERYSVGLMPSFTATNTDYASVRNAQVLAAGIATPPPQAFNTSALPAVPFELDIIQRTWQSKVVPQAQATRHNLQLASAQQPFQIVHLATHAGSREQPFNQTFLQLQDAPLALTDLPQMGWGKPPLDLLVLSACETAVGNKDTELGFAGLAFKSGVKSILASLWQVEDGGALAVMAEFYWQLKLPATIKAEALRRAQVAMLRGDVSLQGGQLRWSGGTQVLPPEIASTNLTHPYYWSAFTIVGNPW